MAKLERTYTVPLRRGFINTPKHRRAKRASSVLRQFLQKHMKSDDVKIGQHLNDFIWKHGMKNPPHKVKVNAVKDEEGVVMAELEGHEFKGAVRPEEQAPEQGFAQKLMGGDTKEKVQEAVDEKAAEDTEDLKKPSRSEVEAMTKDEIEELGKKFGKELSTSDLKKEMIDQFFE